MKHSSFVRAVAIFAIVGIVLAALLPAMGAFY